MHIALCDDQIEIGTKLYKEIKNFLAQRDCVTDSVQLYQPITKLLEDYDAGIRYDVLFLDIEMPLISGLEAAKRIRALDGEVLIIFVTGYPDYMPESFKVEAFDFLTKPFSADDIYRVLTRCLRKQQRHSQIVIPTTLGAAAVALNKIVFIKSDLHYLDFVLSNEKKPLRSKQKLTEAAILLQPYPQFVRCHQSYIINLDYIQEIERQRILLSVKGLVYADTIPISRKYTDSVKDKFMRHHLTSGGMGDAPHH